MKSLPAWPVSESLSCFSPEIPENKDAAPFNEQIGEELFTRDLFDILL